MLKGGRQKALEDEKKDDEESQALVKGTGRGGEFLGTPNQPALEEGVGKTSAEEETPAKRVEEWKTPKTVKDTPRGDTSSTREKEKEGKTASAAETPSKDPKEHPKHLRQVPDGPVDQQPARPRSDQPSSQNPSRCLMRNN